MEYKIRAVDDLTGQKFGHLTVISLAGRRNGTLLWNCVCDCSRQPSAPVRATHLRRGSTTTCGCRTGENLTGNVYGKLTVLRPKPKTTLKCSRRLWECECECGGPNRYISATAANLRAGRVASCGCMRGAGGRRISAARMLDYLDEHPEAGVIVHEAEDMVSVRTAAEAADLFNERPSARVTVPGLTPDSKDEKTCAAYLHSHSEIEIAPTAPTAPTATPELDAQLTASDLPGVNKELDSEV